MWTSQTPETDAVPFTLAPIGVLDGRACALQHLGKERDGESRIVTLGPSGASDTAFPGFRGRLASVSWLYVRTLLTVDAAGKVWSAHQGDLKWYPFDSSREGHARAVVADRSGGFWLGMADGTIHRNSASGWQIERCGDGRPVTRFLAAGRRLYGVQEPGSLLAYEAGLWQHRSGPTDGQSVVSAVGVGGVQTWFGALDGRLMILKPDALKEVIRLDGPVLALAAAGEGLVAALPDRAVFLEGGRIKGEWKTPPLVAALTLAGRPWLVAADGRLLDGTPPGGAGGSAT